MNMSKGMTSIRLQIMRFLPLVATAAIAGSLFNIASASKVGPKIHKLCIEAKDYAGCVRAMNGDTAPVTQTRMRMGLQDELGNSCPAGYAYSGSGQCILVKCIPLGIFGKNEPQLAGKGHSCKGRNIEYGILGGRATMKWGDQYMKAMIDPNCPNIEPKQGSRNSCGREQDFKSQQEKVEERKRQARLSECDFKIRPYECSFNAYLDANPALKKWAELNPEMAEKERVRLKSVD